jgi:hypothetical protein
MGNQLTRMNDFFKARSHHVGKIQYPTAGSSYLGIIRNHHQGNNAISWRVQNHHVAILWSMNTNNVVATNPQNDAKLL